jgi:DNA replication protein DnaC
MPVKTRAEVCPLCEGTGWKTLPASSDLPQGRDRRVTRCDCQLRARAGALLAAARIPRRYERCELGTFEFEGSHRSLAPARMAACRFVEEYPLDRSGLLLVGRSGLGKTHLAVGIAKALIREKQIECVFYDYAELLKQIQDSYNPTVEATELGLLRPLFETEVLVLDDLGSVRPTEWRWDTIRLILNTRYNAKLTTIITTNFADEPAAGLTDPDGRVTESFETARAAARTDTLGDRIGERMRSRLHEMCRVVEMEGQDYREIISNLTIAVACADCPDCRKENVYRRVGALRTRMNSALTIPITCKQCGRVFHVPQHRLQIRKKHRNELNAEYSLDSLEWM